jgi:hypothetical protein
MNTTSSVMATLVVGILTLSGCAIARAPVTGLWYTDTHSGQSVTSNQAGNRVGEACATSILGLIATGDASVEAARRNGVITLVSSVDEKAESYVGVYAKFCTIVRGR